VVNGKLDDGIGSISNRNFNVSNDFLVIRLSERISDERALDGSIRGAFQFADVERGVQEAVIIGVDPKQIDAYGSTQTSYQNCEILQVLDFSYHSCDTVPGVSGSILAVLQDWEYKFHSIHSDSSYRVKDPEVSRPLPKSQLEWNTATPSSAILEAIRTSGNKEE